MYIIETMRKNNKNYYLIPNSRNSIIELTEIITKNQNANNNYLNVSMRKYNGKKYNSIDCVWIIEG